MPIAVIDIGKTNAKLALVDRERRAETAVLKTPNTVVRDGPYPHYDIEHLWRFILDALREFGRTAQIEAITVTTHGATAALVDADGTLTLPVLDYEFSGPDEFSIDYAAVRPPFSETGAPRLPGGLNLGAQLFWQQRHFPEDFARTRAILMYPQYWAMRLTGQFAGEVTSLGCHTDLWAPFASSPSSLVDRLGWSGLLPPMRRAGDQLGPLLPAIAAETGLPRRTPVLVGIHDSNASLVPHLLSRRGPFSVLSTGTWVIAMAVGGKPVTLDPARDTLINVSALGDAVPSARFMGGREYEALARNLPQPTEADIDAVLAEKIALLPAVQRGSGPFPHHESHWTSEPKTDGQRHAAISFYLALMAATCLELIGADGPTVVEGPFSANQAFARMLEAATRRPVITEDAGTGTSVGAALLADLSTSPAHAASTSEPLLRRAYSMYAQVWSQCTAMLAQQ